MCLPAPAGRPPVVVPAAARRARSAASGRLRRTAGHGPALPQPSSAIP